jgi:hypothetical protein
MLTVLRRRRSARKIVRLARILSDLDGRGGGRAPAARRAERVAPVRL